MTEVGERLLAGAEAIESAYTSAKAAASFGMPVGESPHALRQEEAAEAIGCGDANRPADRLSFAASDSKGRWRHPPLASTG
jgi:hypothetical protein